jgi:hypothetical protein
MYCTKIKHANHNTTDSILPWYNQNIIESGVKSITNLEITCWFADIIPVSK